MRKKEMMVNIGGASDYDQPQTNSKYGKDPIPTRFGANGNIWKIGTNLLRN